MESSSRPWHIPRAVLSPSEAVVAARACLIFFGMCVPQITARDSTSPSGGTTLSTPDPTGGVGCQGRRHSQRARATLYALPGRDGVGLESLATGALLGPEGQGSVL